MTPTTTTPHGQNAASLDTLGVDSLNPRSVILSVLLGSHPPALPGKAITAMCELFGFRPGTVRTALSRMVAKEDLELQDTTYQLGATHLGRQRSQDSGRTRVSSNWNGDWIIVAAIAERRSMAERRTFRSQMIEARMGELRPETWVRPANIDPDLDIPGLFVGYGSTGHEDPVDLIGRLWPLEEFDAHTKVLLKELTRTAPLLTAAARANDFNILAETFQISAAVVRFLRQEPQLPPELHENAGAVDQLRETYDDYEFRFRTLLKAFFRSAQAQ